MAAAVENAAGLDHETGRMDFAGDDSLGLNFYAALGEDDSVKTAGDNDLIAFDLTFDFRAFTEDQSLIAEDAAFDLRFQAQSAGKLERSFKADGAVEEPGPFTLRFSHAAVF